MVYSLKINFNFTRQLSSFNTMMHYSKIHLNIISENKNKYQSDTMHKLKIVVTELHQVVCRLCTAHSIHYYSLDPRHNKFQYVKESLDGLLYNWTTHLFLRKTLNNNFHALIAIKLSYKCYLFFCFLNVSGNFL